jgi:Sap, sulfolipid-1-addressing protein
VLLESAGLALLASLSPTALLIAAVYLGSARPMRTAVFYLTGALVMTVVTGVVILVLLRSLDLSHPAERGPRYELRLALGVALVVVGLVVAKRPPRPPDPTQPKQGLISRMAASPAPQSAFIVGILVFAPGATFLAALQVIATARAGLELTLLAMLIVVVINVLLVWMPLVLYLLAPRPTTRYLTAFNGWLRANGHVVLVWALLVAGSIMVGNGIYGLAT